MPHVGQVSLRFSMLNVVGGVEVMVDRLIEEEKLRNRRQGGDPLFTHVVHHTRSAVACKASSNTMEGTCSFGINTSYSRVGVVE